MTRSILLALSMFLIVIGFAPLVQAKEGTSSIKIENAYAYATASGTKTGAVFLTLENKGKKKDRLISAASDIAQTVQIHENKIDEKTGVIKMREVAHISLPPQGQTILEPTGNHIMLINLKKQLQINDVFNVTLTFKRAKKISIPVTVIAPGTNKK